ncbi:MAG: lysophospholipase [Rubrivivax sp.]|jgi:alpha-beta hydrolase superfamily lysophospholipase|nr:alpha/beta hydrolase [Rubrivivax sp.]
MSGLTLVDRTPVHVLRAGNPAAARTHVLIVHGLGEHLGRYAALVDRLVQAGHAVTLYDQRGHGRSGGARGAIPHNEALLGDLACLIDSCRDARPSLPWDAQDLPLVLLGHSMGGAVAARFVAEGLAERPAAWWRPVSGLVLSSPALAADLNPLQHLLLALGRLAPDQAAGNGLKPSWISRDRDVVKAYQADPLVHPHITPRLARFILAAGETVRARADRWQTPTLLMWAEADRCVAPRGSAEMARRAPPGVVQAQPWPGLYHEIFNEPEREQVIAALLVWLDALPARVRPRL